MFEAQSQTELEELMKENVEFRQLYYRHKELTRKSSTPNSACWQSTKPRCRR